MENIEKCENEKINKDENWETASKFLGMIFGISEEKRKEWTEQVKENLKKDVDNKKTNYECIKNMNVKEMAKFIFWIKNNACDKCYCANDEQCICYEDDEVCFCGIAKWLNSEVE